MRAKFYKKFDEYRQDYYGPFDVPSRRKTCFKTSAHTLKFRAEIRYSFIRIV